MLQIYCTMHAMKLMGLSSDLFLAKTTYWICVIYQTAVKTVTAWAKKSNTTYMFPTDEG